MVAFYGNSRQQLTKLPNLRIWRRLPLFLRIFVVVLGAVVCAQAVNFANILTGRIPQPEIYAIADVVAALRTGEAPVSGVSVGLRSPPSEAAQDPRDISVGSHLATLLGVEPTLIRVHIYRPPEFYLPKDFVEAKPLGKERPTDAAGEPGLREDFLIGGFEAAMQMPNGAWRVVEARGGPLEPWQWQSLIWVVGTMLVTVPVAWFISRRIAEPVGMFAAAAERLGRDPSTPPLPDIDGPPEVVAAVVAFNEMQGRIKRYVDDRTTMVAAIAHDLRTPLMRLTLLLEDTPEAVRVASEDEIREMSERIRAALALVRDVSHSPKRQKLNLRTLIESVVDEKADRGEDAQLEDGPDVTVEADIAGLRAMFANLIENAVQYGNSARVRLRQETGLVLVEVLDGGPGIPEDELEKVFQPFYRLETSRSRGTGGSGLGLASARAVARNHGGDIVVSNRPVGGLVACVTIPVFVSTKARNESKSLGQPERSSALHKADKRGTRTAARQK